MEAANFARRHGLIALLGASKPYCLTIPRSAHAQDSEARAYILKGPTSRGLGLEVSTGVQSASLAAAGTEQEEHARRQRLENSR